MVGEARELESDSQREAEGEVRIIKERGRVRETLGVVRKRERERRWWEFQSTGEVKTMGMRTLEGVVVTFPLISYSLSLRLVI